MCFSAEVSFVFGTLLAGVGCACVTQVTRRGQLPLALIPWLFSLHQGLEGVLWLGLLEAAPPSRLFFSAQWLYLFMAHMVFAWWMPLSAYLIEPRPQRRALMGLLVLSGLLLAFLGRMHPTSQEVVIGIIGHSLKYPYTNFWIGLWYIITVILPFLLSSQPRVWWLGTIGLASLFMTLFFYWWTFTSVWCFCAAVISVLIFPILRNLRVPLPAKIPIRSPYD